MVQVSQGHSLRQKVLEHTGNHRHGQGFRGQLLRKLWRAFLELINECLRIFESKNLVGVFLNNGSEVVAITVPASTTV